MQKYDELRQALESECLSSLKASERTQTFAYSINVMTGMIESRFPKWRVVSDVDKLEIHLFYMDKSTVTVLYEVIVLEDGSYFIVSNERHRTDSSDVILQTVQNKHQLYVLVNSPGEVKYLFRGFCRKVQKSSA